MQWNMAVMTLGLSWCLALRAAAQDGGDRKVQDEKKPKDEVVVTASRLEEPKRDVASSITVLRAEDLDRKQQRMVADALREVPALDVIRSGAQGGLTSVFLRGANEGQTLVLIDGVVVNDPGSVERSFDFANLTPTNIDRIEVLRGPQSVLYGSNAMGGVINIISKRGQGDPRVNFLVEGGSFATLRTTASLSGGSDKVNYSLGASHSQTNGISSADKTFGNTEKDGYRNDDFSTRIGLTPTGIFDVDVFVRGSQSRAEVDNGGGPGQDDPNHTVDSQQWLLRAAPHLKLLDGRWEQTLGISHLSTSFEDNNPVDSGSGGAYSFSSFDASRTEIDWQHNLTLHPANILTLGAKFEEEAGESHSDFSGFLVDFPREKAWTRSLYLQDRLHLWDQLTLSAGARIDEHQDFGTHATYRGTAAYWIRETSTKVRATIGTGFKAPSLFQLFSSFGNPDLHPEKSRGWDAGIDQELACLGLKASVTYFRNEFEHLIEFDPALSKYFNIGRAETWGVEAALEWTPFKDFEIRASYTLTDTEDKTTGKQFLRRPRNKAALQASYLLLEGVQVNVSVLYVGERDDLDFSTFPATRVTLPDYATVNLAASWRISDHFEVFARGENLLDKDYEEVFGFGTPGVAGYLGGSITF